MAGPGPRVETLVTRGHEDTGLVVRFSRYRLIVGTSAAALLVLVALVLTVTIAPDEPVAWVVIVLGLVPVATMVGFAKGQAVALTDEALVHRSDFRRVVVPWSEITEVSPRRSGFALILRIRTSTRRTVFVPLDPVGITPAELVALVRARTSAGDPAPPASARTR